MILVRRWNRLERYSVPYLPLIRSCNGTGFANFVHVQEMFVIPEGFQYAWFSDLSAEEMDKWGATLRPSALGSVLTPVQETGMDPKSWKISYLVTTEQDPAMPEAFQKFLIDQARDAGAQVDMIEMKSGHFVQVSHAEEVAEWISGLVS
jgi:hypothetical protein